jgi:hypothetical protein
MYILFDTVYKDLRYVSQNHLSRYSNVSVIKIESGRTARCVSRRIEEKHLYR